MITHVQGKLASASPTRAVIDVHGIGYELLIPLSSYERLPKTGSDVQLLTHLYVREDQHTLYGFGTEEERALFRLLIASVSGIGPKIGLNILSGIGVKAFKTAVADGDVKVLSRISGIGKKTAERILVELKDKIDDAEALSGAGAKPDSAASSQDLKIQDAVQALVGLGLKPNDAQKGVQAVLAMRGPDTDLEEIVRLCLKQRS